MTDTATDATLVKLELISRRLNAMRDELEEIDDKIGEVMFALSGAGLEADQAARWDAFSATLERVDELVAAGAGLERPAGSELEPAGDAR
jgi:hypothetical protein